MNIFDCCISSLFIVGSLLVVVMELLILFNTMYLKLFFFVFIMSCITDTNFIPCFSNTLQPHCLLLNSSVSLCDAKCQGLVASAEHILVLPTVIYSHSNLNALIKETIRKTGWALGEYLGR